jgi:hypothetical protein
LTDTSVREGPPQDSFYNPFGLYQFKVMPFGLSGAPAMDTVLIGMQDFTTAYLDDLVVFSNMWAEHLEHMRKTLGALKSAGLTTKPQKCQFGMAECKYLGHRVGSGIVQPELDKLEAVRKFAVPKTK